MFKQMMEIIYKQAVFGIKLIWHLTDYVTMKNFKKCQSWKGQTSGDVDFDFFYLMTCIKSAANINTNVVFSHEAS